MLPTPASKLASRARELLAGISSKQTSDSSVQQPVMMKTYTPRALTVPTHCINKRRPRPPALLVRLRTARRTTLMSGRSVASRLRVMKKKSIVASVVTIPISLLFSQGSPISIPRRLDGPLASSNQQCLGLQPTHLLDLTLHLRNRLCQRRRSPLMLHKKSNPNLPNRPQPLDQVLPNRLLPLLPLLLQPLLRPLLPPLVPLPLPLLLLPLLLLPPLLLLLLLLPLPLPPLQNVQALKMPPRMWKRKSWTTSGSLPTVRN